MNMIANRMVYQRPGLISQWRQLRACIDELESEISKTSFPHPTARMCEFLIIAEDHRFARHPGVDLWALCRAGWKTYLRNSRQGGSTIAMQLVRTITGHREATWQRKIMEILLAIFLSQYVSRNRLPILYLWCAYYGWKMNNFREACIRLQIDPASASAVDEAKLIARLKYPQPQRYDAIRMRKIHRRGLHIMSLAMLQDPDFLTDYLEIRNETI